MNKNELIKATADKCEVSATEAELIINGALELVMNTIAKGEEVKLSGFGVFELKERAARIGTNPSTNVKIEIPASKSVSFKVSKAYKAKLN